MMLTDEELEALLEAFQSRMDAVSQKYYELIGAHMADIGTLTASDLHRIKELNRMGSNLTVIQREIAKATHLNAKDVRKLIEKAAISAYGDYAAYGLGALSSNTAVLRVIRAQAKQTANAMANLSNTTVVSSSYKQCIDKAIASVQSGVTDYKSATRAALREMAADGLRVTYASGLTRRLDTAARQNVLDATKQINQAVADAVGEQFGADGVEISAHLDCAEDHLYYQGRQMSKKQFEDLQGRLRRLIGEWNCRHFAFPIILGVSEPAYSQEQLNEFKTQSTEKITIDGVTKTRYQWTQEQRKLETKVRYAKNEANACKAAGDDVGRRYAQSKINAIDQAYIKMSKEAGIPTRRERMAVSGFNRVKASQPAQAATKKSVAKASNSLAASRFSPASGKPQLAKQYADILELRYQSGTIIGKRIYDKYVPNGGVVSDGSYTKTAHFRPIQKDIRMDFAADAQNRRGSGATWYHEHGHFIDYVTGKISDSAAFNNALIADCKSYVASYRAGKALTLAEARKEIGLNLFADGHKKSAVSDLMEGASGGKIRGMYGHMSGSKDYWKRPGALTSEAFAHMMESEFDSERRLLLQTYFPTAFAEFEKLLKGVVP